MEVVDVVLDAHAADQDQAVRRLLALGHRVVSFAMKRYEFPDGVVAEVCGEHGVIRTWTVVTRSTPAPGVEVVTKRPYFAPYLDWSSATRVGDERGVCTSDVLITKDLAIRIAGDGAARTVRVLWTPSDHRRDGSRSALGDILRTCGMELSTAAESFVATFGGPRDATDPRRART